MHYQRWKKGKPLGAERLGLAGVPITERFWRNVERGKPDECWLWEGHLDTSGYGSLKYEGRECKAHRVALMLAGRVIPDGDIVRHDCDVRACVNPGHLLTGSHKDNAGDRDRRGRNGFSNKTHCPRGHEYSEANTYIYRNSRTCRLCKRDGARLERQLKRRQEH